MTSQPNLSKGLTITWITEKPFKDKCRVSSDFCLGETTWYLQMEYVVDTCDNTNGYYAMTLIERENREPKLPFSVFIVVDVNRGNTNNSQTIDKTYNCFLTKVFYSKQYIWRRDTKSMSGYIYDINHCSELIVVCVFKDVSPSVCRIKQETNDFSTQTDIEWPLTNRLPPAILPDSPKDVPCAFEGLSGDLSNLLDQQHFADLKLRCRGRSFSVHRSILAARSGVFASKLEVESVDNESPVVDIPDVDDDILELLLEFVYTGKIMSLNDESAPRLYAAGRLYGIHGMPKACLEWMVRNLSQDNCVAFLAVSNEVDDVDFKNSVVSFIVGHPDVLKTENWKKLSKVQLKLANEVYEKLFSSVFD